MIVISFNSITLITNLLCVAGYTCPISNLKGLYLGSSGRLWYNSILSGIMVPGNIVLLVAAFRTIITTWTCSNCPSPNPSKYAVLLPDFPHQRSSRQPANAAPTRWVWSIPLEPQVKQPQQLGTAWRWHRFVFHRFVLLWSWACVCKLWLCLLLHCSTV